MKSSFGKYFMGDFTIWGVFFALCAISLVEVFSAGSALAYKSGNFMDPLIRQAEMLAGSILVAWLLHFIPYRNFRLCPIIMVPTSIFLLLYTLFFSRAVNGGSRWIRLGGLFTFQPSEFAKLSVIMAVALILANTQRADGAGNKAFKSILWVTCPIVLLIFSENLSTAILLSGVVFLMMFVGRVPLRQLGKLAGVGALIFALGFGSYAALRAAGQEQVIKKIGVFHRVDTWVSRVDSHAEGTGTDDPAEYDLANNAQSAHANIAIASSNVVGKLPGNSVERDFLAQAFSDFIFAIIIEEMGIGGAAIVVILYVTLLVRGWRIASRCEYCFPAFLCLGLVLMLVSQALLNMLIAVGLFPVSGQPLPIISRGGTSTIIFGAYFGIILSVSRSAKKKKKGNAQVAESVAAEGNNSEA